MLRVRPAIEAGFRLQTEAANVYIRQLPETVLPFYHKTVCANPHLFV